MPDEAIKKQTASITLEGKQPSSDVAAISSPSSIHVFGTLLDTFFGTPVELMIVANSNIGLTHPEST